MSEEKKLWGGRFKSETDEGFAVFNRSFGFDRRLFEADIQASSAHCEGLRAAGVLTEAEAASIRAGLSAILERAMSNLNYFDELSVEDVHSFIEARLIEIVGDAGRKLHTGRSRNDQVATALRLWLRQEIDHVALSIHRAQEALLNLAERHPRAVLPGYTHLQRAQPILWAQWCLAYFEMLRRDRELLAEVSMCVIVSPLATAALDGTSF